ncbi:hypothetical protein [Edaphobacter sp. DSM 109919]|uniref:Uncharacterized protein n=1 Tax=Edaphobacter paludis TaxID=3035702 RepID=A0AAU7CTB6_9BACT
MKVRIPKIALSLALAVPASHTVVHIVRTVNASDVIDRVVFYADVPDRFSEVVTNFKMLPERMNPTCSECN